MNNWNHKDPSLWLAGIVALVVGALVVQLPLHNDEAGSYMVFISKGLKHCLTVYSNTNNHVLYSALSTLFVKLPIHPFVGIRLASFLAFLGNAFLIYKISRLYRETKWNFIGVLLWIGSFGGLYYSIHARGYGLQTMFSLVALYLVISIIDKGKSNDRKYWLALALSCALGFFTLPTFLFPFVSIMSLLVIRKYQDRTLRQDGFNMVLFLGLMGLIGLVCYAPILHYSGLSNLIDNQWVHERKLANLSSGSVQLFMVDTAHIIGYMIIPAVVLLFVQFLSEKKLKNDSLMLTLFIVGPMLIMVIMKTLPFPRTFSYAPSSPYTLQSSAPVYNS